MFFFLAHLAPDSGNPDAARCMAGYYPSETTVASSCYYNVADYTGRPYCCPYYDKK